MIVGLCMPYANMANMKAEDVSTLIIDLRMSKLCILLDLSDLVKADH